MNIPNDYPVQPLAKGEPAERRATCGTCELSWDDGKVTGITPAPSARCPFKYFHDVPEHPAGPWTVKAVDEDAGRSRVFDFDTEPEARAFYEGIEWVQDSAIYAEAPLCAENSDIPLPERIRAFLDQAEEDQGHDSGVAIDLLEEAAAPSSRTAVQCWTCGWLGLGTPPMPCPACEDHGEPGCTGDVRLER